MQFSFCGIQNRFSALSVTTGHFKSIPLLVFAKYPFIIRL